MVLNDAAGPLTAGLSLLLLAGVFRAWRRGDQRRALLFVVCFGALLRIYFGSDRFLHAWDERFHAVVARNFLAHPLIPTLYDTPVLPYDYRDWTANHIWLHKPPLALWLAAGSLAIFGINELALRVPALLLSTVSILLTYRIGYWVFGPTAALLAATFHAGNGLLVLIAAGIMTSDHVDNLFIVLIEASMCVLLAWARRPRAGLLVLLGAALGAAVLTKLWPALFVLPIFVFLAYGRMTARALLCNLALVAGVAAAVAAPWFVYVNVAFPQEAAWESRLALQHLSSGMEAQRTEWSYYLLRVPRSFGELVFVPLAWFLVRTSRRPFLREDMAIALWLVIPLAVFSVAASKSIAYVAIAAPAIFLAQAAFLTRFTWDPSTRPGRVVRFVLIALLLILPFRFAAERLNPLEPRGRRADWAEALRALAPRLPSSAVLFGTSHPIEAMFITGRTAYEGFPTEEQVRMLTQQGRIVAVCKSARLPRELSVAGRVWQAQCGE